MKLFTLFFIVLCCISCVDTQNEREPKFSDAWKVSEKRNTIDIKKIESLLHHPEIHIEFSKMNGATCLKPYLDFYPIVYFTEIQNQLFQYFAVRSSINPPSPITYHNKKYIVLAWNFEANDNQKYCDYDELTKSVIERYHLKKYKKITSFIGKTPNQ